MQVEDEDMRPWLLLDQEDPEERVAAQVERMVQLLIDEGGRSLRRRRVLTAHHEFVAAIDLLHRDAANLTEARAQDFMPRHNFPQSPEQCVFVERAAQPHD